jgi:hypothetical protein
VQRLEIGGEQHIAKKRRHGHVSGEVWAKLVAALQRDGVQLLPENEWHGAGVAVDPPTRTAAVELVTSRACA